MHDLERGDDRINNKRKKEAQILTVVQCDTESPGVGDLTRMEFTLTIIAHVCGVKEIITPTTVPTFVSHSCKAADLTRYLIQSTCKN